MLIYFKKRTLLLTYRFLYSYFKTLFLNVLFNQKKHGGVKEPHVAPELQVTDLWFSQTLSFIRKTQEKETQSEKNPKHFVSWFIPDFNSKLMESR